MGTSWNSAGESPQPACGSCAPMIGESNNGFITLHEERYELSKSEFHFPSLQRFINDLNRACTARWETRLSQYERVFALLVRWEDDDLGVVKEIGQLEGMFSDTYGFDVETWVIPSTRHRHTDLANKIQSALDEYDTEGNLILLYYGGHAFQQAQSQPTWLS
jgi:hypothetical protein